MIYIDNIVKGFSKHDPKNANVYLRNGKKYKEKIILTIQPIKEAILKIPENKRWLVSCEGAFSYLARDFKLKEL
jgi:manganese/iron transport system substrate-binding protein